MRLTLERGLPVRPAEAPVRSRAAHAALVPTDSSAGRAIERRRQ